jgi:hypothetical protein
MTDPIRWRDDPPPLPDGYVLVGLTARWQATVNRFAWYVQRRLGLEKRYPAHTFSTLFSLFFVASGFALFYATPATSGVLHWMILVLFFLIEPVALFVGLAALGTLHEKPKLD